MRRLLLLSTIALAAVLAACTSSSGPGWTYAPPTEPPASQPAASGEAPSGGAPSGEAPSGGAPSGEAPSGAAPSGAAPSGGTAGGDVIELTAQAVQWDTGELNAPADTPFVIRMDNQDAGIPHNVEIKDGNGQTVFRGDLVTGVASIDYPIDALAAGAYQFICTVHPNMVGTLTVGG